MSAQMRALVEMEQSGMVPLLAAGKHDDLHRMYSLFRRVPGGADLLKGVLGQHVRESGKALVMDPERTKDPVDFVQRLLTVRGPLGESFFLSFWAARGPSWGVGRGLAWDGVGGVSRIQTQLHTQGTTAPH